MIAKLRPMQETGGARHPSLSRNQQKPLPHTCGPEIEICILTRADIHSRRRNREAEEKGAKNSAADRSCQSGQGRSWVD